jgi:hypothetical protein
MRVAIMQPYFFPYIGYWQLIKAVDRFVILDNVSYIKQGWVNRNRLLINGSPAWWTLPLKRASSNRRIDELEVVQNPGVCRKLLNAVYLNYKSAPYFGKIFPMLESMLLSDIHRLSPFLRCHMLEVCRLLNIDTELVDLSDVPEVEPMTGQDRILALCKALNADVYVNLPGGRELYSAECFESAGIRLEFILPDTQPYNQHRTRDFVPNMSIIDMLMHIGPSGVAGRLK